MRRLATLCTVLLALGGGLAAEAARGHAFAPSLLEIEARGATVDEGDPIYDVRWKQPALRPAGSTLRPRLPETCRPLDEASLSKEGTGVVAAWSMACDGGLVGREVAVDGIGASRADVLLRLRPTPDASTVHHVLTADAPSFVVPGPRSALETAGEIGVGYAGLGVEHILLGFDHLLFVLGLLLLVRGGRRLLATITAFTLGHSVTLGLAALGFVHVPQGPVEVLIALSIYWTAVELGSRQRNDGEGLFARAPWTVAGLFGLLHGLGFAGALSEIGLPEGEIPAALFAFNVGIEAGQLAFVGVVLGAATAWRRLVPSRRMAAGWRRVAAYLIGSLSAFWVIERIAGLV